MSTLDEVEKAIASLSRREKAQLLQSIARDGGGTFAGIESRRYPAPATRPQRVRLP